VGNGTFAPGQMYVALSRCTSLEGIVLRKALQKRHILLDWAVVRYLTHSQYDQAARSLSRDDKFRILEEAIREESLLQMVYLKGSDERSQRIVKPLRLGEMEYAGRPFPGLEAWCMTRRGRRVFNIDRILSLQPAGESTPASREKS
jgi:ATP-dependent DNA helicase PIF1